MTYLDRYKARMKMWGEDEVEQFQNIGIQNFEEFLLGSPSKVYIPYQGNTIMGTVYSNTNKEYTEVTNYVLTRLNETVSIGTVFTDPFSRNWLITSLNNLNPPAYNRYKTLECNKLISWEDQYGFAHEVPCYLVSTLDSALKSAFNLGNELIIPKKNGVIMIVMPEYEIAKDQRFIIKGKAWQTTGIDNNSADGIMFVTLTEDLINTQTDDLINEIADKDKDTWTIVLNNNYYKQTIGSSFDIEYTVYHNGLIVTEPVSIVSNNNYVTINGSTITSEALGVSIVTVAIAAQPTIKQQATVEIVSEVTSPQTTYSITGDDSIKWGNSSTYQAYKFINGVQQATACTFSISDITLATGIVNGNEVELTANLNNKTGVIVLQAHFADSHVEEKPIRIVSLWS